MVKLAMKTLKEIDIHIAACDYMRIKYPDVIFTSEASGVRVPIHTAKQLKRLRSSKGLPDLLIFEPRAPYAGLMIEIKRSRDDYFKKDGTPKSTPHIQSQQAIYRKLIEKGYASFV